MQYNTGTGQFIEVDGMLVEEDTLRIAEAIHDYDENLVILCVDPGHVESISEEPYIIAEKGKDGVLRPVLRAWKLDEIVLERLKLADIQRNNPLAVLEDMEAKGRAAIQKRYQDFMEEARDIVYHVAGIKHKYSVRDPRTGELITFYDDRPATRK